MVFEPSSTSSAENPRFQCSMFQSRGCGHPNAMSFASRPPRPPWCVELPYLQFPTATYNLLFPLTLPGLPDDYDFEQS